MNIKNLAKIVDASKHSVKDSSSDSVRPLPEDVDSDFISAGSVPDYEAFNRYLAIAKKYEKLFDSLYEGLDPMDGVFVVEEGVITETLDGDDANCRYFIIRGLGEASSAYSFVLLENGECGVSGEKGLGDFLGDVRGVPTPENLMDFERSLKGYYNLEIKEVATFD